MKRNSGTLFTQYHAVTKIVLALFIVMNCNNAYGQYRIIADSREDSCYFIKKYPHYDIESQTPILGVFVPEHTIEGKDRSLLEICLATQKLVCEQYKDSTKDLRISLDILVDEHGQVRGSITPDSGKMAYNIAVYAFNILKKQEYKPAIQRKPIAYTFFFTMQFPSMCNGSHP